MSHNYQGEDDADNDDSRVVRCVFVKCFLLVLVFYWSILVLSIHLYPSVNVGENITIF
jgi:hypothetical protein